MKWIETLMDSPVAWATLSIIAIISFAYAIICQNVNKEKKEFSYVKKSNVLIREKKTNYGKLSIAYDGNQIESLCVSKIVLWNSGNRTLCNTDIVESKEVTITAVDGDVILDVEIITCSEETNMFSVTKVDEHCVKVFFDYVDPKDGIAIQIIHTGTEDSISLYCKIKGGKPIRNHINEVLPKMIRKVVNPYQYEKDAVLFYIFFAVLSFVVALLITMSIFIPDLQEIILSTRKGDSTTPLQQDSLVPMAIAFWVCGLISVAQYYPLFKKLFNVGVPLKLRKHL